MEIRDSIRTTVGAGWSVLRDAFRAFQANDPLRIAAATSFFTSFAIPPIMVILIEAFGLFTNPRSLRHALFDQLGKTMDLAIATQVRQILRNLRLLPLTPGQRIGGFIFLLFVATTLFEVIRSSLNQIWRVRRSERASVWMILQDRLWSIAIILLTGVLFFAVLQAESLAPLLPAEATGVFSHLMTTLAGVIWVTVVLRYLSYARPSWRTAVGGGIFTGLLLAIGFVVLHAVLSHNNVQNIYGASTSLVLLLLFVFYCSFIFYFGACFTAVLADRSGRAFRLTQRAARYTIKS